MISVYFILLLIVQIVILFKTIKNNDKNSWILLLTTIGLSMGMVGMFFGLSILNSGIVGWNVIIYLIICAIAGALYFIMLIISGIMKLICMKKSKKQSTKNYIHICIISIILSFIVACSIESIPYIIKYRNDRIAANTAREKIVPLLNQKYGDGNFKIKKMQEANICKDCIWFSKEDGYEFTISTDYMNSDFIIDLSKDNFKITDDSFLENYYGEKNEINNLKEYLEDYKVNQINKAVSSNFNATIDFNNVFVDDFSDKDYEKIPSLDELANNVELHDPKFDIKENLTSKEELLNYLVKLTAFFINDLDTSNIVYSQESKYFRYKYDYTKLGVNDYTDKYSGYGGYVLAGEYKYSEDKKHYVAENEDKIVRINVMGNVTTYNLDDILKST